MNVNQGGECNFTVQCQPGLSCVGVGAATTCQPVTLGTTCSITTDCELATQVCFIMVEQSLTYIYAHNVRHVRVSHRQTLLLCSASTVDYIHVHQNCKPTTLVLWKIANIMVWCL